MPERSFEPTLRQRGMSLADWFRYTDRGNFDPTVGATITTDRFTESSHADRDSVEWEREEWSIRSTLVPLSQGEDVLQRALEDNRAHDVDFTPHWRSSDHFDFAEATVSSDVEMLPWVHVRSHPLTGAMIVDPRADFLRYHCVDRQERGGSVEYQHPLDGIRVMRTGEDSHPFYNPTARVTVHRNYLRDYLSARRVALLVAVVADRFANAPTDAALELDVVDLEEVGQNAWRKTTLHSSGHTRNGLAMGRASLYWNLAVLPYERPKVLGSCWPFYGSHADLEQDVDPPPLFVADAEGRRCTTGDAGCPSHLYFRPQVLEKYLTTPGHRAFFHMRTWGGARGPRDESIDVGINSRGLMTAFAPDIARLRPQEQQHWAHHSSLPDGEVCRDMWETRQQQRPPDSPGVVELVESARTRLAAAYQSRFGEQIYGSETPLERDSQRMSIGPLRGDMREVVDLSKPLFKWVVESLEIAALRAPLDSVDYEYDTNFRQIVLLRLVLNVLGLMTEADARSLAAPLVGLNELRVASAHALSADLEGPFQLLGIAGVAQTPRDAWNGIVDSVVICLGTVAAALEASG